MFLIKILKTSEFEFSKFKEVSSSYASANMKILTIQLLTLYFQLPLQH